MVLELVVYIFGSLFYAVTWAGLAVAWAYYLPEDRSMI
jgi:hypothetical protein